MSRRHKKMAITKPFDALGEILYMQADQMAAETVAIRAKAQIEALRVTDEYRREKELKDILHIQAVKNGEVLVQEEPAEEISEQEQAAMDFDPSQLA